MQATILLVDDDALVLAALARSLRAPGRRVLAAVDPREAMDLLAREGVDVIVSDNDMPGMQGVELLAHARRAHPDAVRILLTGRSSLESALAAINGGEVFRYLTKPWDEAELAETIAQALERAGERRRAAAADLTAARRRRLMAELEREQPGITIVTRGPEDAYTIDEARALRTARLLGCL